MGVTVVTSGGDVTVATSQKVITADNATVQNSDLSYNQSVAAGETLALPDITITKNDDTTTTYPSAKDIDLGVVDPFPSTWDEMAAFYGRGYHYPKTGQSTVYRTGDDADIEQTLFTNAIRLANSKKIFNTLADFTTLNNNNAFGNTNRFTDSVGGQNYIDGTGGAAARYAIDHYTGLGWYTLYVGVLNKTWNQAIDEALAETVKGGFDDWFIPNDEQLYSILNMGATGKYFNYDPFTFLDTAANNIYIYTSTTELYLTSYKHSLLYDNNNFTGPIIFNLSIAFNTGSYIICRKHY